MGDLAAEGRFTDAVRAFAGFPFNDEDNAVAEDAGYFEAAGRYAPNLLELSALSEFFSPAQQRARLRERARSYRRAVPGGEEAPPTPLGEGGGQPRATRPTPNAGSEIRSKRRGSSSFRSESR